MCTKNLHVDIWSWVIGHGELESGVYFDRGGRRAALFGFFFVAPQGRPAPAPCLVCCSGLLRVFMAPEGREKIPEKGARHRGRLRWPHAPPDPKGGSRGALTLPRCAHARVATGPFGVHTTVK